MLHIGCHLSSSKGYVHMGKEALSIGANTFQFFTRNPRGGAAKAVDEKDVQAFRALQQEMGIGTILAHAPYTLNGCSADEKVRDFARRTMLDDLKRLEYVPGNLYNFQIKRVCQRLHFMQNRFIRCKICRSCLFKFAVLHILYDLFANLFGFHKF